MTVVDTSVLGRPIWYELMTTDVGSAEAFYRAVVNQTFRVLTDEGTVPLVLVRVIEQPVSNGFERMHWYLGVRRNWANGRSANPHLLTSST